MTASVCITGGLGVIGSWITRTLVRRGLRPVVIGRRPDFSLLPDCDGRFDFVPCDVREGDRLLGILREANAERVIHAAAFTMALSEGSPVEAVHVNAVGTATVMDAAGKAGAKRVVLVSSGSIYDVWHPARSGETVVLDENHPIRPVHISRITKVAAEEISRYFARRHGFGFAAIRSSTMLGPGKLRHHGGPAIHSRLIENAYRRLPTRVERGGDQRDDLVYVADIAHAVVLAALADETPHDAYNIGSGVPASLHDLAQAIRMSLPEADITIGPGMDYMGTGLVVNRIFDITRARRELGFEPQFDLRSAVANYLEMLRLFEDATTA